MSMVGVLDLGVAGIIHSDIDTVFDHVTPDVLQTFKVKRTKVKVTA